MTPDMAGVLSAPPTGGRQRPRYRPGFTLIELLVVVAIIAVLVALPLPSLGRPKRQAKRQTCAARVRSLCQASLAYRVEWQRLPEPLQNFQYNCVYPSDIQSRLLNQLSPFLGCYRLLPVSGAASPADVPRVAMCPFVQEWANSKALGQGVGPWTNCRYPQGQQQNYWQAGYGYFYGLDYPGSGGQVLTKGRSRFVPFGDNGSPADAVLWMDIIGVYSSSDWWFTHVVGGVANSNSYPFFHNSVKRFEGVNVGTVDGAVSWRPASQFDVNVAQGQCNGSASYNADGSWWYWF